MSNSVILPDFHVTIAESILKDIRMNSSRYYYYFGKTLPFNVNNTIEEPSISPVYGLQTRNDIIAIKRITSNDVSTVVPRYDWTANEVYDQYDDSYSTSYPAYSGATSLENAKFFVLVPSSMRVYKCIDNNNNALSTVQPAGTDSAPIYNDPLLGGDGYKWKFMFEIPPALQHKFLTPYFIPVTTAVGSNYYNNGGLTDIVIVSGGTGYSQDTPTISLSSNVGVGAKLHPVVTSGIIAGVVIENGGINYTTPLTLTINSTSGSGALLVPVITDGIITDVTITSGGSNYPNNTTINLASTTGTGAFLSPIVSNGSVTGVAIVNHGEGYFDVDINVMDTTGTGAVIKSNTSYGSVNTKQATVELSAIPGSIDCIKVLTKGNNYSSPIVIIEGDGTGCTAEAIVDVNAQITNIIITNPGSGYTKATVTIYPGTSGVGTGCTARAILSPAGGHGKNARKELYASRLLFSTELSSEKFHDFSINNDYRQFGIIKNPLDSSATTFLELGTATSCFGVSCSSTTQVELFPNDTILTVMSGNNTGDQFAVVTSNETTTVNFLLQPLSNSVLTGGELLQSSAGDQFIVLPSVKQPTVDKFSGDLLYIDNRNSFYQSAEQIVSLQTVIKF